MKVYDKASRNPEYSANYKHLPIEKLQENPYASGANPLASA